MWESCKHEANETWNPPPRLVAEFHLSLTFHPPLLCQLRMANVLIGHVEVALVTPTFSPGVPQQASTLEMSVLGRYQAPSLLLTYSRKWPVRPWKTRELPWASIGRPWAELEHALRQAPRPDNENLLHVVIAHSGHSVPAAHLVVFLWHHHGPILGRLGETGEHRKAEDKGVAVLDAELHLLQVLPGKGRKGQCGRTEYEKNIFNY